MGSGGLSKARLGRLHDVMAGHVGRGAVPGLVTLLSRRGEVHENGRSIEVGAVKPVLTPLPLSITS